MFSIQLHARGIVDGNWEALRLKLMDFFGDRLTTARKSQIFSEQTVEQGAFAHARFADYHNIQLRELIIFRHFIFLTF